jgi:hypothetical protein
MKSKTITAVALVALLSSVQAVQAQYNYGVPGTQTTNALPADQAAQIRANFSTRFAQIRAQIADNTANGRLTQASSASLSAQLSQLEAEMNTYVASGALTNDQVNMMMLKLTQFANATTDTINSSAANRGFRYDRHNNIAGNRRHDDRDDRRHRSAALATAIDARINSLRSQISASSRYGQITRQQQQYVQNLLDNAVRLRDESMHHGLDDSEAAAVNSSLDSVNTQLQSAIVANGSLQGYGANSGWHRKHHNNH